MCFCDLTCQKGLKNLPTSETTIKVLSESRNKMYLQIESGSDMDQATQNYLNEGNSNELFF